MIKSGGLGVVLGISRAKRYRCGVPKPTHTVLTFKFYNQALMNVPDEMLLCACLYLAPERRN